MGHVFINVGHAWPLWPFTSSGVSVLSTLMGQLPEVRRRCLREAEQERREQKVCGLGASVFPSPKWG